MITSCKNKSWCNYHYISTRQLTLYILLEYLRNWLDSSLTSSYIDQARMAWVRTVTQGGFGYFRGVDRDQGSDCLKTKETSTHSQPTNFPAKLLLGVCFHFWVCLDSYDFPYFLGRHHFLSCFDLIIRSSSILGSSWFFRLMKVGFSPFPGPSELCNKQFQKHLFVEIMGKAITLCHLWSIFEYFMLSPYF